MSRACRRNAGHTRSTTHTNARVAPNRARPDPSPAKTAIVPETAGHQAILPVATAATPAAASTGPRPTHTVTRRRDTIHQAAASATPPTTMMAMTMVRLGKEPDLGGQLSGERRDHGEVEEPSGRLDRGGPGS